MSRNENHAPQNCLPWVRNALTHTSQPNHSAQHVSSSRVPASSATTRQKRWSDSKPHFRVCSSHFHKVYKKPKWTFVHSSVQNNLCCEDFSEDSWHKFLCKRHKQTCIRSEDQHRTIILSTECFVRTFLDVLALVPCERRVSLLEEIVSLLCAPAQIIVRHSWLDPNNLCAIL